MDTINVKTAKGSEYTFTRIPGYDLNGNARYLVSFLALGLRSFEATTATRRAGLRKYSGKSFGGGFSFQGGNLLQDAEHFESLGLCRPLPQAIAKTWKVYRVFQGSAKRKTIKTGIESEQEAQALALSFEATDKSMVVYTAEKP